MGFSNLTICYEAIQRSYRNAVVEFVRKCMMNAFPADYRAKLQLPFTREWDKMASSAGERRQTGELTAELKDDFDLLGVNHFFNLLRPIMMFVSVGKVLDH